MDSSVDGAISIYRLRQGCPAFGQARSAGCPGALCRGFRLSSSQLRPGSAVLVPLVATRWTITGSLAVPI
jgi:hypothetical protein